MPEQPFRCKDCPEHSGTRSDVEHLQQENRESKSDRKELWNAMDANNRRISERVTTKVALWTAGIAVSVFLSVITIVLTTSARVEDKVDALSADIKVLQAVAAERNEQAEYRIRMLQELKKFREQEADDPGHRHIPYGKPKGSD